nr:uncharacterized protein LOC119168631 [Rhipicephalus microplus]
MSSMLAPWQRLDALRTFVYPALNFPMWRGVLSTTDWRRLNDAIRPLVKRTLYLPTYAATNYIYSSAPGGAVGILIAAELSELCRIDSAFKLLTSPDAELRQMALDDAYAIVTARLGWEVTRAELEAYFGGMLEDGFRVPATQLRSIWTNARKASRHYNAAWTLDPGGVRPTCGDATITPQHRCRVMRTLREILATERIAPCTTSPTKGSALYQARHNAIVDRVRPAASHEFIVAFENQAVGDTGLRPDLILVRGEEAIVIDVTCLFENTPDAFENARNAKLAHYEPVAAFLGRRYQRVTVDAVIVGALGAWDSANDRVLRRICSHP